MKLCIHNICLCGVDESSGRACNLSKISYHAAKEDYRVKVGRNDSSVSTYHKSGKGTGCPIKVLMN